MPGRNDRGELQEACDADCARDHEASRRRCGARVADGHLDGTADRRASGLSSRRPGRSRTRAAAGATGGAGLPAGAERPPLGVLAGPADSGARQPHAAAGRAERCRTRAARGPAGGLRLAQRGRTEPDGAGRAGAASEARIEVDGRDTHRSLASTIASSPQSSSVCLAALDPSRVDVATPDAADTHVAVSEHLRRIIERALRAVPEEERLTRQAELCNAILAWLRDERSVESVNPGEALVGPLAAPARGSGAQPRRGLLDSHAASPGPAVLGGPAGECPWRTVSRRCHRARDPLGRPHRPALRLHSLERAPHRPAGPGVASSGGPTASCHHDRVHGFDRTTSARLAGVDRRRRQGVLRHADNEAARQGLAVRASVRLLDRVHRLIEPDAQRHARRRRVERPSGAGRRPRTSSRSSRPPSKATGPIRTTNRTIPPGMPNASTAQFARRPSWNRRRSFTSTCRPWPFQREMLQRLEAERERHHRYRNLVVAATGTGKTLVAAFDYRRLRETLRESEPALRRAPPRDPLAEPERVSGSARGRSLRRALRRRSATRAKADTSLRPFSRWPRSPSTR